MALQKVMITKPSGIKVIFINEVSFPQVYTGVLCQARFMPDLPLPTIGGKIASRASVGSIVQPRLSVNVRRLQIKS